MADRVGRLAPVRHGGGGQRRTPCASRPVGFWLPAFPFPSCSRPPPRVEPPAAAIQGTLLDCCPHRRPSTASATAATRSPVRSTSAASLAPRRPPFTP